jgi:hypothetical protein
MAATLAFSPSVPAQAAGAAPKSPSALEIYQGLPPQKKSELQLIGEDWHRASSPAARDDLNVRLKKLCRTCIMLPSTADDAVVITTDGSRKTPKITDSVVPNEGQDIVVKKGPHDPKASVKPDGPDEVEPPQVCLPGMHWNGKKCVK